MIASGWLNKNTLLYASSRYGVRIRDVKEARDIYNLHRYSLKDK